MRNHRSPQLTLTPGLCLHRSRSREYSAPQGSAAPDYTLGEHSEHGQEPLYFSITLAVREPLHGPLISETNYVTLVITLEVEIMYISTKD